MSRTASVQRLRKLERVAGGLLALVLAAAVLVDVSQAGRHYVFCTAMQNVVSHACCAKVARAKQAASRVDEECCQIRSTAELDPWLASSRVVDFSAPFVAIASRSPSEQAAMTSGPGLSDRNPVMRTGPPQLRALARLMVFRI